MITGYNPLGVTTVRHATTAVQHARHHGLTVPDHVIDAERARAEVAALAHRREPDRPHLPDDPADLAALISEHAAHVADVQHGRSIAAQFTAEADARLITAVAGAVPAWITALTAAYTDTIKTFGKASARLSDTIDPARLVSLPPARFKDYQRAHTAAVAADRLITARRDLDRAGGQPPAGRYGALAAACQAPPLDDASDIRTTWQWIAWARRTWEDHTAPAVRRWQALAELQERTGAALDMAPAGQLTERAGAYDQWHDALFSRGVLRYGVAT